MAEGEQCLKDCLRLAPTNHAALVILGELYLAKGDSGSALKSLKTADNADCPTKLRNRIVLDLAQAYVDQSTLQPAKQQLAQINETGSARYNYIWGQIQFLENDVNLALNSLIASKRTLDQVLSKNSEQVQPSQPLPEDAKAAVEQLLGEIKEGLKRLQWNDGAGGEDSSGDSDEM
jgi:thioredoxin-like negative regulator of GroEL